MVSSSLYLRLFDFAIGGAACNIQYFVVVHHCVVCLYVCVCMLLLCLDCFVVSSLIQLSACFAIQTLLVSLTPQTQLQREAEIKKLEVVNTVRVQKIV